MHWILVAMLNLIFCQAPAAEQAKKPQAWDVKTIQWQVNSDGTKDALLEGRRDVPGKRSRMRFSFRPVIMSIIGTVPTPGSSLFRGRLR
jgi:hypothetical protein